MPKENDMVDRVVLSKSGSQNKKIELIFFGKIALSASIDDHCLINYPENNLQEYFSFK
jgi:hypothetical protein